MPRKPKDQEWVWEGVEHTARPDLGATAIPLPAGEVVIVTNMGTTPLYVKLGADSGVDASDMTTGGGRFPVLAQQSRPFIRRKADSHAYLYAEVACKYHLMGADKPGRKDDGA